MSHTKGGQFGERRGTLGMRERFKDARHDTYQERQKWPEPTRCTECGAVFASGRWTWNIAPAPAHETVCPACKRIADHMPAGIVSISGTFFEGHRDEIVNLIHNVEELEKGEHPLERMIAIRDDPEGTSVTTTGVHLARRIGEALESAYKGKLIVQYADQEEHVRVSWNR